MEVKTTKATQLTFEQAENEMPSEKTVKISSKSHTSRPKSAFEKLGFKDSIKIIHKEIQGLYLADNSPWIIGYSGGKDSTGTLQLIWYAVAELPKEKRQKTINVIYIIQKTYYFRARTCTKK